MQNWLELSEKFGNLSLAIQHKRKAYIEQHLVQIIECLLQIADEKMINMHDAWDRWRTKALSKKYD